MTDNDSSAPITDEVLDVMCEMDLGSSNDGDFRLSVPHDGVLFEDSRMNFRRLEFDSDHTDDFEDPRITCSLREALLLRKEYMDRVGSVFPSTTRNFIDGNQPENCERMAGNNNDETSFNAPHASEDHWGLNNPLPESEIVYRIWRVAGVMNVGMTEGQTMPEVASFILTKEQFLKDLTNIQKSVIDGPTKSFCFRQMELKKMQFNMHTLYNENKELKEQKSVSHRDFYNLRKVDTHIHGAALMNQKHILRFIKGKMKREPDTAVMLKNGKEVTLHEVFEQLGISSFDLSIDLLNMSADRNTFHRFDQFNSKDVFLKTDNYIQGRFFAELIKEVFIDMEDSKYEYAEPRLSIYGRNKGEWDNLAKWAIDYDVWSPQVKWMIQIPRLYDLFKKTGIVNSFDNLIDNIFSPLFEVTNDPSSHPHLHRFLLNVSGFDCVDDESKQELFQFDHTTLSPPDYTANENPPYNYYLYYLYANLCSLNAFRRLRGFNTFALRPHCGEAGHTSHLIGAFLTSESIAHGILLRKAPVMQYLFYLTQMGIAMSPISNNKLFLAYPRNPFHSYFEMGLNVSLSTDDPLQFHVTRDALMEEYSNAINMWKLSSVDLAEIARNSVLQSGFEDELKRHWLGEFFKQDGVNGNNVKKTNVPRVRIAYRQERLVEELRLLFNNSKM